jgi:hypothetical protein
MTADVRIAIENYEVEMTAMNNQRLLIVSSAMSIAEKTGFCCRCRRNFADVFVPPGAPESLH